MDIREKLSKEIVHELFGSMTDTDEEWNIVYNAVYEVLYKGEYLSDQSNDLYNQIPADFLKEHLPYMIEISDDIIPGYGDKIIIYWFVHG